jgi:hypothetical protein
VILKGRAVMAMSEEQLPPEVVMCNFKFITEKSKPAISGICIEKEEELRDVIFGVGRFGIVLAIVGTGTGVTVGVG